MKKKYLIKSLKNATFVVLELGLISALISRAITPTYAATTPDLGQAESFAILSDTYTNTVGGTTINGDLGYTTGPATAPTVNGTTYISPASKYSTAGTDQAAALVALNAQPCTYTFAAGAVDLATDTGHGTIGIYAPGVYCTTAASAASIGAGGITLSGAGTFIFRINGALTTVANSVVTVSGGASSCDVFWTPTAATTLGATSTFAGTDIDASGITIGSTVTWTGRALAFGGTVTTDTDTLATPTCAASPTPSASPTSSDSPSTNSAATDNTTTSNAATNNEAPCIADPITNTPLILEAKRISSTSVYLSWGPFAGLNDFNVRYGPTNGNWLYNTNVNGFSTSLNNLPANEPIWVQVASRNSCAIGTYSEPRLIGEMLAIGGPRLTIVPLLPNTGFDPDENTISDSLPVGIIIYFLSSIAALVLTKKLCLQKYLQNKK